MPREKVGVGFVGTCGFMAQTTHIPVFQALSECELIAGVGNRPSLLNAVADRFNIPKRYSQLDELCADDEVDAVVVMVQPHWNPGIVIPLIEAGKHVLCEKPIALSVQWAQRLADVASSTDRIVMVAYMKRYDPGVERALELVKRWNVTGEMGKLLYARAHCFIGGKWTAGRELLAPILKTDEPYGQMPEPDPGPNWLPPSMRENIYSHANPYYHFNHVHCHNVNLIRAFLGNQWHVKFADFERNIHVIEFEFNNVPVVLEVGGTVKHHGFDEHLTLYFEGGWLCVKTPPPLLAQVPARVIVHYGEREQTVELHADWDWSFRRQALHFLECIRDGKQPRTPAVDAVEDVRISEAVFRKYLGIQ